MALATVVREAVRLGDRVLGEKLLDEAVAAAVRFFIYIQLEDPPLGGFLALRVFSLRCLDLRPALVVLALRDDLLLEERPGGIRLESGEEIEADSVLSSVDVRRTFIDLMEPGSIDDLLV